MEKKSGMARFFEIYRKNLEKQYGRKRLKVMKFFSTMFLTAVGVLAVGVLYFTPQRMIIGTWEYDFDESYMFRYGEQVQMGSPLYPTLSFENKTRMSTGETYYINRKELGIKALWESGYTTFQIASITPNKLILRMGDPRDLVYTYNVYRKK